MNVWELRSGRVDAFAPLVMTTAGRARAGLLIADGRPKEWSNPPAVEFLVEKRSKKQLPRADVPSLVPGALALTAKARDALGPLPSRFGQLLELDCHDAPAWYFNVTNVVDCLDRRRGLLRRQGAAGSLRLQGSRQGAQSHLRESRGQGSDREDRGRCGFENPERLICAPMKRPRERGLDGQRPAVAAASALNARGGGSRCRERRGLPAAAPSNRVPAPP